MTPEGRLEEIDLSVVSVWISSSRDIFQSVGVAWNLRLEDLEGIDLSVVSVDSARTPPNLPTEEVRFTVGTGEVTLSVGFAPTVVQSSRTKKR